MATGFWNYFSKALDPSDSDGRTYAVGGFFPDFFGMRKIATAVLPEEQYRPDKLSMRLYGSQDMSWAIDVANGFVNGIREYVAGVRVVYPAPEELRKLGLI